MSECVLGVVSHCFAHRICSELVSCFDMMDARRFLVMPVTCRKIPVWDARHKNISRRVLLFDRNHQESIVLIKP